MRRHVLIALAAGLAVLSLSLVGYQWAQQPTTLRIAVGPIGSEDTRLVAAIAQYLARERSNIRLKLVMTEGVAESAAAIDGDRADLAVVRTDVAMPAKGQTVAILHRDAAVLLALAETGLAKVSGLTGRTIGVVRNAPANRRLLDIILDHYEIPRGGVTSIPLATGAEAEMALRQKGVDAVLAVGTISGRTVTEAVAAATQAGNAPPMFIPVGEANAIAQRSPFFETVEVVRGAFGGTPPRPAETFTTLGVSHRLVAQAKLEDGIVSELARLLFVMRPSISSEVPLANRIDAPDVSKSSSLPVHPGAGAYYEGEVQTFFERYGDWFYLVVMVLSIVGSAGAGVASSAANRSRARNMALLSELLAIVRGARHVETEAELDTLEAKADEILAAALAKAGGGGIDNAGVAAFTLGLDQARRAIAERRKILLAHLPLSQAAE